MQNIKDRNSNDVQASHNHSVECSSILPVRSDLSAGVFLLSCFLFLAGCKALQLESAGLPSGSAIFADLHHVTPDRTMPPLTEVWSYNAAAAFGEGPPLLVGETILVGTRKGEVHAIDFATGKRRGMKRFGEVVEGTPALQGGLLFVPVGWGRQAIIAYDLLRSKMLWRRSGAPIAAGVLPTGEDAFVAVDTEAVARKYGVEGGDVLWEYVLGDTVAVHATPLAAQGHVILADDRGHIIALHPESGELQWATHLQSPVYTSPTTDGKMLYVPTTRGRLYALEAASGDVQWEMALPDTTVRLSAPAVDDDIVVVGGSDGELHALDIATGSQKWSFRNPDALIAAPMLTPTAVYVGSMGGMLYAIHRQTGELWWHEELPGRIKSAMAARDGYLLVLSEPRYVTLFRSSSAIDG